MKIRKLMLQIHMIEKEGTQLFFFSLRIFLLEQKLHMAWQQNLANTMASPRNLQHNTTKEIKIVNTKHTYI